MRIALIQMAPASNPEANAETIIRAARKAARLGADLCVAPLEALASANSAKNPLFPENSLAECAADMASALTGAPPLLVGDGHGPVLINGGMATRTGDSFQTGCLKIHIHTGDAAEPPSDAEELAPGDVFLCMRDWSWRPGCQETIETRLRDFAIRNRTWTIGCNLAGGRDQLVFGGGSPVFAPDGGLFARGAAFEQDCVLIDLDCPPSPVNPWPSEDAQWLALVVGTRDFIRKSGADKALIGLSGGMDSAFVACIAQAAIGAENVMGALMPSPFTSEASIADAMELARNLGIKTFTIPISPVMETLSSCLEDAFAEIPAPANDLTFENMQARIRGLLLMALANRSGALVLNTGNKSETSMGYCTMYGDTVGALAVIGDIFKTRVYELAERHCSGLIPRNIFNKAPSAELRPNQKDTDSLPPYDVLDPQLAMLFTEGLTDRHTRELRSLAARVRRMAFKRRQAPPTLLVGGWLQEII